MTKEGMYNNKKNNLTMVLNIKNNVWKGKRTKRGYWCAKILI